MNFMSLFKNFGTGFRTYGAAISMLFSKGFWGYLFFPLAINIILFAGGIYGIGELTEMASNYLTSLLEVDGGSFLDWEFLVPVKKFLAGIVGGFVWVLLKLAFFFVFTYFGGYIVIIVMSPIFAFLSEKTEERLTGNEYPFNGDQMMRDVARGILLAMRNLFIEMGWMIGIFILSFFIPLLGGIIGGIILFFISAYFYGFSFIDYTNERRRLKLKQSIAFVRANKGFAIANGMVFAFFLMIPFCGTFLAGFVALVSVIAATIATHEIVDLTNSPFAKSKNEEAIEDAVIVSDEKQKVIEEDSKSTSENSEEIDDNTEERDDERED